jgi:hypothetical protein
MKIEFGTAMVKFGIQLMLVDLPLEGYREVGMNRSSAAASPQIQIHIYRKSDTDGTAGSG